MSKLSDALKNEGIEIAAAIDFDEKYIVNRPKYERLFCEPCSPRSVLAVAVPYRFYEGERNISQYAVARDYHLYFQELAQRLNMLGFADTSPFDERQIALDAGLGVLGQNGLLITKEYGSYVFIGVFFSTEPADRELPKKEPFAKGCLNCGRCKDACPSKGNCLSALTQKKRITEEEAELLKGAPLAWGCDICQEVCPMNKGKRPTDIPFFKEELIPLVDTKLLSELYDKGEAQKRAWSWRGREVIERQIKLFEKQGM